MKNKKGFTLVEGIVVSVMVAVLAIAGIVFYNNYVQNSAQQSVNQMAETVATAANSYARRFNQPPPNLNVLNVPIPNGYNININQNPRWVQVTDNQRNIQSPQVAY